MQELLDDKTTELRMSIFEIFINQAKYFYYCIFDVNRSAVWCKHLADPF